jgi:hypothetical protein
MPLYTSNALHLKSIDYAQGPLSSAKPYEFLVKLRNITWETNYVIVSQNALGMMGRRKPSVSPPPRRAPLNVLYYPYIIPTILYGSAEESAQGLLFAYLYLAATSIKRPQSRSPRVAA